MSKGLGHEESGQHRDTGNIPFGRSSNYVCRLEKRDQLQHAVGWRGEERRLWRRGLEEQAEVGFIFFFFPGDLRLTRLRRSDE